MLLGLGFTKDGNIYRRHFENIGADLAADFKNQKLVYPEDKGFCVNDGTTSNFSHPENFVVFECVARLFEKGYRPDTIELEPRWSLGHGGKSGKADICVKNKDGSPYLCIIECKTADTEYKKELQNMKADGGQLFSYWQQSKATKWLVLYASDFDAEQQKITYTAATVNCSDDANFMELAKDDKSLKLYKDAATVESLFEVWKETYEQKFYGDIIFDDETVAYDIGVLPLKKKRLVDFSRDDKIVNQFEEILRHNNVSDKENAFNRLIALFIAKLYDEKTKGAESEVEFQYKTGTDTYQKMQDRLQKLHHYGMKEFMKEDVFYVADDYVKNVMRGAIGENREQLEAELNETITKLKFYTNNDFAFKDVHNKALFYQNGKILVEMVELFQKYRIIDSNELQLLGDMFEQLLNKGFKQNEGQFFTPIPITCFIWKCLPLESIIVDGARNEIRYPKIIDYACGAGHFLTEGFREINETVARLGLAAEKGWERDCIFGIEKDYRLARVSKISLFMHGADNGNIVFGDGLDNHNEKIVVENGQFDILVANPPYSVSAFKNHLELKNNALNLLQYISKDGKEIETLFVERIAQLLKPKGIAAVILPSSILSNASTSYIKAREEILKNFALRAIVQFGSKTFGATGTNTVVLYLQKNDEPPVKAEIAKDNVTAIFGRESLNVSSDIDVLNAYCEKIGVSKAEYIEFAKDARETSADWEKYNESAYFGLYAKEFAENAKKLKEDKRAQAFFEYAAGIEKEKLYYFALVYKQHTLVVTAPSDNAAQEAFLGYGWSNRKGDEGIKIKSAKPTEYCGALYNADGEEESVARYVKDAFLGIYRNGTCCAANALKDMIDFSRVTFDKAIKCNVKGERGEVKIESRFPMVKLGEIAPFVTERINSSGMKKADYITTDNLLQNRQGMKEFEGELNFDSAIEYHRNDILVSNIRPYLKKIWFADRNGGCSPDVLVFRAKDENKILPKYLFAQLSEDKFFDFVMANPKGMKMPRGDKDIISSFKIPLPPPDVQKAIADECEQVDAEYQGAQKEIADAKAEIARIMAGVQGEEKKLKNLFSLSSGKALPEKNRIHGNHAVYGGNGITGYHNDYFIEEQTIVIGRVGEYCGSVHISEKQSWVTDNALYVTNFLEKCELKFLCEALKSANLNQYANRKSQPNVSQSGIADVQIPVPPLAEQKRIVGLVEAEEQKIAAARRVMAECSSKKQAILDKWLR